MAVLTFSDVAQSYGADDIFMNATGSVPHGARIGLVGPNGVGKTSLLRILVGLERPADGLIHLARSTRVGYLQQHTSQVPDGTLWSLALDAVSELRVMEQKLRELSEAMADPDRYDEAVAAYTPLEAEFERRGGYSYEHRIRQTLHGLGFAEAQYQQALATFSGGQKTRAMLARLLLQSPDLLVLDEPTNHLDIAAVEWLENTLRGYPGAILLVSHDRYFLNRVANNIWEMGFGGLEHYKGDYTAYLTQRKARWAQREQTFAVEKARLLNELDYVKRNIAGQNVAQAKGKLRRLSREIDAIERGGMQAVVGKKWAQVTQELGDVSGRMLGVAEVEERIKALKPPYGSPPEFKLRMQASGRSGDVVLQSTALEIGYPDNPLFTTGEIDLRRGECAALIGPNGSGKSTFLRTVLGEHRALDGTLLWGASVHIGYFAQAHEGLNPARTLVDEIMDLGLGMGLAETRNYLGRFMFSGDDVFRTVSTLSGGERGRLALAKLTLSDSNVLLLDEPTNHLDIPAQEVLQSVLGEFAGTILLVSHDRYLIDYLATQIWAIEGDTLNIHRGGYQDYLAAKQAGEATVTDTSASNGHAGYRARQAADRAAQKAARQREDRIATLEKEIAALEARLQQLTAGLEEAGEAQDIDRVHTLGLEYETVQAQLSAHYDEWSALG